MQVFVRLDPMITTLS